MTLSLTPAGAITAPPKSTMLEKRLLDAIAAHTPSSLVLCVYLHYIFFRRMVVVDIFGLSTL